MRSSNGRRPGKYSRGGETNRGKSWLVLCAFAVSEVFWEHRRMASVLRLDLFSDPPPINSDLIHDECAYGSKASSILRPEDCVSRICAERVIFKQQNKLVAHAVIA